MLRGGPFLVLFSFCALLGYPLHSADPAPATTGVLGTYVRGPHLLVPGTAAAVRIATHRALSATESHSIGKVAVQVRLAGKDRSALLFRGETDDNGLTDAFFQVPPWPAGAYTLTVTSRLGADENSARHEVQLKPGARLLLQSDKPLYQPGQTLHLRALAVRTQDGRPLPRGDVLFEIYDPRDNRVVQQRRPVSSFGITALDVPLAAELLLGGYRARATLQGEDAAPAELTLEVARYVLPKFKVQVETDRRYYEPGQRVRLQIAGRYFHGKPVAGGAVTVRASLRHGSLGSALGVLSGTLDATGQTRLELDLPKKLGEDETLSLQTAITDRAEHREGSVREVPVSSAPLQVEIVAEAGGLVPGLQNRVWVVATYADGSPVQKAEVTLSAALQQGLPARGSDALGVAEFSLPVPLQKPARADKDCPAGQTALLARVRDRSGHAQEGRRCLAWTTGGSLLVRTDRAIYPRGVPLRVTVLAPGQTGTAYLDLLRDRQLVSTAAVTLRDGVGEAVLPPDERRFGTLVLQAYHHAPGGARISDSRLLYVERDAALRVEVTPQLPAGQDAFRPGQAGQLHLRVLDAGSGAGVRAALGVVMVDEALLALRPLPEGRTRTYFTLTQEAQKAADALRARPAGHHIEGLVEGGAAADEATRQEAARILLAGAAAPWDLGWEVDPWQGRAAAWEAQKTHVAEALSRHLRSHVIGERERGAAYRYRADLVQRMVDLGALPAREARDPWARPLGVAEVVELAGLPASFDEFARGELNERLTALYGALRKGRGALAPDPTLPRQKAVRFSLEDLQRLADAGGVPRGRLVDPWGTAFRVVERRQGWLVGGLTSRFVLASAGPDGVAGTRDDLYAADGSCHDPSCHDSGTWVAGLPAEEAFAEFKGACGCAYGTGGGHLSGRSTRTVAVAMSRPMVLGGVGDKEDRVRSAFPETLLFKPEVLTDEQGRATLDVPFADSITTWRLNAEAIAEDGRLGQALTSVRVFQDFFVDLDLPAALTQNDEIAVPVAVHNYLKQAQRVELQLDSAPWFTLLSEASQRIDLAPGEVGVRHFRIRITGIGVQKLLVRARGTLAGDAIERSVDITPDGVERLAMFQGRLGALEISHQIDVPAGAIPGTPAVALKIYPALSTHVLSGVESLLRVPSGCFEQTSSTTYPNALILEYLRRTGKSTPALERQARDYLQMGYQRLLSFEVRGGGFSWFGEAPANQVLTAYGLEEFQDMARVFPVDRRVIERTQRWLLSRQQPDGSFAPDRHSLHDGVTEGLTADVARITAYIAVALQRSGMRGPQLDKARDYVGRALREHKSRDPFTLVLAAELFSAPAASAGAAGTFLEQLWATRSEAAGQLSFQPLQRTPTYGRGTSGTVETTALAARLFLRTPGQTGRADRALSYLLGNKDSLGNWHSTQATIRSLQALLAATTAQQDQVRGRLEVSVDGQAVERRQLSGEALQVLSLDAAATPGSHRVTLRYVGQPQGQVTYQLVGRHHEPRGPASAMMPAVIAPTLTVRTVLNPPEVRVGGALVAEARVSVDGPPDGTMEMPMVRAGLPPGFDLDREALEALVRTQKVEKFEVGQREVTFYLRRLLPGQELRLPLHLTARTAALVQVPAPTLYEYYQPERRAEGAPQRVRILAR